MTLVGASFGFPTRGYSPLDSTKKYQKSNVTPLWLEFDWLICLLRNFVRRYIKAGENDASITEYHISLTTRLHNTITSTTSWLLSSKSNIYHPL